jgi:hypothetical protein
MVNYEVWVQLASLLCILLTIFFTIRLWTKTITCNIIRCDGHHWFEWSKCVALGMWILNNFIDMQSPCLWIILQLCSTKIHFDMSLFKEMDIDHESINLNQEIMCTCSIQHWQLWMWLWDVLFCGCERFYLLGCCWGVKMVMEHGRTTCIIVRYVSSPTWMAQLTHLWQLLMMSFIVCCVGGL